MDRRQFIFAAAAALIGPPVPTRLFERTVGPDVDVTVELSFGAELGRAVGRYIDDMIWSVLAGQDSRREFDRLHRTPWLT